MLETADAAFDKADLRIDYGKLQCDQVVPVMTIAIALRDSISVLTEQGKADLRMRLTALNIPFREKSAAPSGPHWDEFRAELRAAFTDYFQAVAA